MRDRAWFYLAKIRYQRGYLPEAEEALAKVEKKLPPQLEEERGLLLGQAADGARDYAGAAGALSGLPLKGAELALRPLQPRHRPAQVGRAASAAAQLLDELGKESAPNEEYRSLRDRANVALGFSALSESRSEGRARPISSASA